MIAPAFLYKNDLESKLILSKLEEHNKFYHAYSWTDYSFKIEESDWSEAQYVSLNTKNEVTGFFYFSFNRATMIITGIGLISFIKSNNPVLLRSLNSKLLELFKYGFRKANFSVIVGNPIEKSYDKWVKYMKGRIVGTYYQDVKLVDGKYYDKKWYEIISPLI